jgi:uncharacterized protein
MRFRLPLIIFTFCAILFAALVYLRTGYGTAASKYTSRITRKFNRSGATPALTRRPAARTFEQVLIGRLKELESVESEIKTHLYLEDTTIEIRASVPRGKPIEWIIWSLGTAAQGTPYELSDVTCGIGMKCKCVFIPVKGPDTLPRVVLSLSYSSKYFSRTAKMAILVQDFGFEANQTTIEYLSFTEPLTVSLVPAKRLSAWTARIANEYRKEIVLLLPMEPMPRALQRQTEKVILLHSSEQNIRSTLTWATQSIPYYAGFSSYYGSEVLQDSRIMSIVLSDIRKRQSYFIDTRITRKSVVRAVAEKTGVPWCGIDGQIGENTDPSRLRDTLRHFGMIAQKTGSVLVGAAPTLQFIRALREELPVLKQNGIRMVYVSEVLRHPGED